MRVEYVMDYIRTGASIIDESDWVINEGNMNYNYRVINRIMNMVEDPKFLHSGFNYRSMKPLHNQYLKFEEMTDSDRKMVRENEEYYGLPYEECMKRSILYQLSYSNFLCTKAAISFPDDGLEYETEWAQRYRGDQEETFPVLGSNLVFLPFKTFVFDFSDNQMEFLDGEDGCYWGSVFWHENDRHNPDSDRVYIMIYLMDKTKNILTNLNYGFYQELDRFAITPTEISYSAGEKAGISKKTLYIILQLLMYLSEPKPTEPVDTNPSNAPVHQSGAKNKGKNSEKNSSKNKEGRKKMDKKVKEPTEEFKIINSSIKKKTKPRSKNDPAVRDKRQRGRNSKPVTPHRVPAHWQRYWCFIDGEYIQEWRHVPEYTVGANSRDDCPAMFIQEPNIDPDDVKYVDHDSDYEKIS